MNIVELDIRDPNVAEEIWELQHPAYRAEAALIGVADLPPLRDTVQSLRDCGETFVGMRTRDGELAGAISYEAEYPGYTICRLMVHPDYFRQGIGLRLVSRVLNGALGTKRWTVTAESRNVPALALYERAGFVRRETYRPAPDIEMVRLARD